MIKSAFRLEVSLTRMALMFVAFVVALLGQVAFAESVEVDLKGRVLKINVPSNAYVTSSAVVYPEGNYSKVEYPAGRPVDVKRNVTCNASGIRDVKGTLPNFKASYLCVEFTVQILGARNIQFPGFTPIITSYEVKKGFLLSSFDKIEFVGGAGLDNFACKPLDQKFTKGVIAYGHANNDFFDTLCQASIIAGDGDDVIKGSKAPDYVNGGAGQDQLIRYQSQSDIPEGVEYFQR